jgi:cellulose synthase/poly-beta-1,6-N-acetylglucosamine synthase-like glycosyltransferase
LEEGLSKKSHSRILTWRLVALHDPGRAGVAQRTAEGEGVISFSIGICATGNPPTLVELIDTIETERFPPGFSLEKVIIVASACTSSTLNHLERIQRADSKIVLIEEDRRNGKAAAINRILQERVGDYLALVNADALPSAGSISRLLRAIRRDEETGMVSGIPVIATRAGTASRILELMWGTHNTCSQDLNPTMMGNHGTDELMVVRSEALSELPSDIVNDGAYIAGRLRVSGYSVRSIEGATVMVDVPSTPVEIIKQRRRILYGHLQVWKLVGRVPVTAESLILLSPERGFSAVVRTVARRPQLILALPFAAVCEFVSFFGAVLDTSSREKKHGIWERYAD